MSTIRRHYKYEDISSRWGGMQLREEMDLRLDKWLSGFSDEEKKLMLELLSFFYYYSEERVKERVVELYQKFLESFDGKLSDIIFTKILKEYGESFSEFFFSTFWFHNNLKDYSEPNIESLVKEVVPPILAIVDDYSGTGKSFVKTVDQLIEANSMIVNSTIYFLTLHITQRAMRQIEAYSSTVDVPIKIIALDVSDEAFRSGYLFEEVKSIELKEQYFDICTSRSLKETYIFGYEDTASLVAFHYNTPNNTLGLFWADLADFAALFPRHKSINTTLKKLQNEAKARKKRHARIVVFGTEDPRLAAMTAYCSAYSEKLSLENMKRDFGLTSEQLDFSLRALIEKGYIIVDNNTITPTQKLKSHMFVSRLKEYRKSFQESRSAEKKQFNVHEEYIPVNF